jgi:hypothetical protein
MAVDESATLVAPSLSTIDLCRASPSVCCVDEECRPGYQHAALKESVLQEDRVEENVQVVETQVHGEEDHNEKALRAGT